MASDARVRYTKMVITESFVKLLKTNPINKITVKEICAMSEINRATFYKHYLDVYDLLDKIEEQFLTELKEVLNSGKNNTARDVLTFIMVKFKAEEEIYKSVCSPNGDPEFPKKLFEVCYDVSSVRKNLSGTKLTDTQSEWVYRYIAHGCNGVLTLWIANGMKEPINEIADFLERLIKSVCKSF
ncbi:MAG: TetR family transcriptional regulator C-terminal domain-containing protein [Eubacterium sp.]|nr:TetR family transcriptional regulator C-terminal domain-containing protein [Eubacterium sp.]